MVVLGRNCSQGKLKLIYLMLVQAAMIVKSLPKYMNLWHLRGRDQSTASRCICHTGTIFAIQYA